jgi:hypothetical protein
VPAYPHTRIGARPSSHIGIGQVLMNPARGNCHVTVRRAKTRFRPFVVSYLFCLSMRISGVEPRGFEPLTSAMQSQGLSSRSRVF